MQLIDFSRMYTVKCGQWMGCEVAQEYLYMVHAQFDFLCDARLDAK